MRVKDIVEITFLDHVSCATEPLQFKVWGRVSKVDKKYVVIQTWAWPDSLESDCNTEEYCIVRSCISDIVVFR